MVDGGRHQVGRPLSGQLNNEFAEIGFGNLNSASLQRGIEMNLFGGHRFRLHGELAIGLLGDLQNDLAGILGRAGPVHLPAVSLNRGLQLRQVLIQMSERVFFDLLGPIA